MPMAENNMENEHIKKLALEAVKDYLGLGFFTARKLTDTPTDALSVVNRRYVTRNGVTANRPVTSILGEFYYDTTLSKPVWWNGSTWKDAAGNNA